jgi:hypothetical protein
MDERRRNLLRARIEADAAILLKRNTGRNGVKGSTPARSKKIRQ